MTRTALALPLLPGGWPIVHDFASGACVIEQADGRREVRIGGALVGCFTAKQRCIRNALLLGLCDQRGVHYGRLAKAFGVSSEMVRLLRQVAREDGLEAAMLRGPRGSKPRYSEAQRRRLHQLFEAGVGPKEAHAALKGRVSWRAVERVRTAWLAAQQASGAATAPAQPPAESAQQLVLPAPTEAPAGEQGSPVIASNQPSAPSSPEPSAEAEGEPAPGATPVMREYHDDELRNAPTAVRSARQVQHLGAWLLVAMVARLGLFARATSVAGQRITDDALRIALEALVVALGIGQRCAEGVRRVATPSAGVLLRAQWAPSASWTRRILGSLSREQGGLRLHMELAGECLRQSRHAADAPAVFYVDNHLRPYRGQQVIRRGWRMQDKRVVPGTTDYYVHDEDGRPLFRFAVPENAGLTEWLPGIAHTLREVLQAGESMVLAFDRAGAFAEHMALLRDDSFAFVTYERRPYPKLPASAFTEEIRFDDETVRYTESRINLGKGRGRLRRIAMLVTDRCKGVRQVNLVATGTVPAATLIAIMRGRWRQENGLKHGVVRWGINQLDGRTTEPYPEDAIIPNPARRRLDRALRAARLREGAARCELADLAIDDPKRIDVEQELEEAAALVGEVEAQRAVVPSHAPLAGTELAGVLRRHPDEYKVTVDAVRIACANAESELAVRLAPHMKRPAEAKKLLANLFASPGRIHAGADHIVVHLQPAGTIEERTALSALLASINRCKLTMPGDSAARPLRFTVHI